MHGGMNVGLPFANITLGSEIGLQLGRTRSLRITCRNLQHYSYPRWTREGLHQGCGHGGGVHGDMHEVVEAIQVQFG